MKALFGTIGFAALVITSQPVAAAEGDAARGARAFRACMACHALEADRNMTGPSLAGVWNRKAGSLPSFSRYSEVMKQSGVTWNDKALDGYLKSPSTFMPGNHMTFPGIEDDGARADIITFLKQGTQTAQAPASPAPGRDGGMMGGGIMGGGRAVPKLKDVEASGRVTRITYCRDTFRVTTADGKSRDYWERNLRFKTDSSEEGPAKEAPAIVGAGMMGDRASVIFSAPEEIGHFILREC
jgi:cytochrome c